MPHPAAIDYAQDTIAARATAPGRGAIGIVRISGQLTKKIVQALTGDLPAPRYAALSQFVDAEGQVIDEGLTLYFEGPNSFTGEDLAEFHGHGGPVVLELLLQRILALGARQATPGEFSQRAFLNDKIDLAQAEAIADLIAAASESAARSAVRSLRGEFSSRVSALVAELTQLRVLVEAAIDFPDEEVDLAEDDRLVAMMATIQGQITALLTEAGQGVLLTEGARLVLAGKPNAGKSSLMNRLTGDDTSIVTDVPGTTRDLVTSPLLLDDLPLHLTDTAGLRDQADAIEAEGIKRASRAIGEADLALLVIDASLPLNTRQQHLASLSKGAAPNKFITLLNKADLVADPAGLTKDDFSNALPISCKTGAGLDHFKQTLKQLLGYSLDTSCPFSARKRHLDALAAAAEALTRASALMQTNPAAELLAEELRQAQTHLGQITGTVTPDDLLGEIFANFCIGK